VFAGQSVPAYEVNQQTLDLLTQLKQANERQDKYNELIVQDMQLKADEYKVEGILMCIKYSYKCFHHLCFFLLMHHI